MTERLHGSSDKFIYFRAREHSSAKTRISFVDYLNTVRNESA